MSDSIDKAPVDDTVASQVKIAAGDLSRDVLGELWRPLRELRQLLAVLVEKVDRHISESRGPTPLSWSEVELLRQQLADAYLLGRSVSRMANEVAEAIGHGSSVPEAVDVNELVESALTLTRHRCSADTTVLVDLGGTVFVRAVPGRLTLVIATIFTVVAEAVFSSDSGKISIETRRQVDPHGSESAVIRLIQQGAVLDGKSTAELALVQAIAQEMGGCFDVKKTDSSVVYILQFSATKQ